MPTSAEKKALHEAMIDHGLAAIELAKHLGEIDPGPISRSTLAAYSGLHHGVIERLEKQALARAYQAYVRLNIHPIRNSQSTNSNHPHES
jgi:hypothetical protein